MIKPGTHVEWIVGCFFKRGGSFECNPTEDEDEARELYRKFYKDIDIVKTYLRRYTVARILDSEEIHEREG